MPCCDELREVLGVARLHLRLGHLLAEHLQAERVEQQARGDIAVGRILLDQRARRRAPATCALPPSARRRRGRAASLPGSVCALDIAAEPSHAVSTSAAIFATSSGRATPFSTTLMTRRCASTAPSLRLTLLRTLLRALFAVKHVGARDVVLAGAHQCELDLVLDVLDVKRAARRLAAHERLNHRVGQPRDLLAHARRRRALPPFTARNALVIATEILAGSKPTTAPLRRMILYSAYCAEPADAASAGGNSASRRKRQSRWRAA